MKNILLFGAGKSASFLIKSLLNECAVKNWRLTVADNNLQLAQSKLGASRFARAINIQVEHDEERASLIEESDVVISLLPPLLHILVARDCLRFGKNLLTASYIDENISALEPEVKRKGIVFLCEMGLDPGIDHMSAMQLIDKIKFKGGKIHSFRSHCGGLVAPESDDNPWRYKISWNPRNVVMAGKHGAVFLENGEVIHTNYEDIFDCHRVMVDGLGSFAYYPNRDALDYLRYYGLEGVRTFIRTTLRRPEFCKAWKSLVRAGLTDDNNRISGDLSLREWSKSIRPFVDEENKEQLSFLGLFEDTPIPPGAKTSADILQYLLETRLPMRTGDKDMIVMLHQLDYELDGRNIKTESCLVVKGEDSIHTAMAKTVGLPLGIAASNILEQKILLTGLHIPTLPEIYTPVLQQLNDFGISFKDSETIG